MILNQSGRIESMNMQKNVFSIDIGGTNIKCATVFADGSISNHQTFATPVDYTGQELLQFFGQFIEKNLTEETIGIGISTLGVVNEKEGIVTGACSNLSAIKGILLKKELERKFSLPVKVMNDVNAAALGERFYGAGRDLQQFFCITLGTGIGGAFVYRGEIIEGANGLLGEVGYLLTDKTGSYEDRASAKALMQKYGERQACQTTLDPHSEIFSRWVQEVARGLCEIIYVLDPGVVIIGGGISKQGKSLTEPIQAQIDKIIIREFREKTRIIPAKAGNAASLMGVAATFFCEDDTRKVED